MSRVRTGLERLLMDPDLLRGRRWGLLAHGASLTPELEPAHLAFARRGRPPTLLFGPEHGFYGVEQDMVPSGDEADPWTGAPIRSLYGRTEASLRPESEAFDDLDLLVVDLQDVGARFYTYAATAIWAADGALGRGREVWILDRPNPLGGEEVEGPLRRPGFESFVGAFRVPVRHGLTLGELARFVLGEAEGLRVWRMEGWNRSTTWEGTGLPWIAPSPNMPTLDTAFLYPGLCLVEGTTASEGRGTTRPFRLVGAPGVDPPSLASALAAHELPGVRFVPVYFRPQFQKHGGSRCGGVEIVVTDRGELRPVEIGVRVVAALHEQIGPEGFWRREAYEFVDDVPAIDLLAGSKALREALEGPGGEGGESGVDAWLRTWNHEEEAFLESREGALLY